MNKILNFRSRREEQFNKEIIIDTKLNNNIKNCPETISTFLLFLRDINRTHFKSVSQSSFLQYANILEKNLDHIDNIYNNLLNMKEEDMCNNLKMNLIGKYFL
jgi:hypothetical protein